MSAEGGGTVKELTGETKPIEPENAPMTDEELEAFALQLMEELPPEAREMEVTVKEKSFGDGPSALENFEVWKKHPATKARWRKNFMLALAVFGVLFVMHLRVPVQWFLPSAEDIARVELCPVTADGTTDVTRSVNAKDPAALLEALEPLHGGLQFSSFVPENTRDHYRAIFYLQNGKTVIFSWNWSRVIIVYENGLTLELESALEFGAKYVFNSERPGYKLARYWEEHGIYKK